MRPYFWEFYRDKKGEHRWRIVSGRGKNRRIICDSGEGYRRRIDCARAFQKLWDHFKMGRVVVGEASK